MKMLRIAMASGVALAVLGITASASAVVSPPQPGARGGSNTEMTMSGTGPGQGVVGFIANASNPFDPVTAGYPPTNPTSGFTAKNEGFAGVIHGAPTSGGATIPPKARP